MKSAAKLSLGTRLSLVQAVIVVVVMGIFIALLSNWVTGRLEQRTEKELTQQTELLITTMSSYHASLVDSADKMGAVFQTYFPGKFSLDPARNIAIGDKQTPVLTSGSSTINLNTEIIDRFTSVTKAVGTVFVRSGDDFIRVATSLKKEDGSRAIGTVLDRTHSAYAGLLKGEAFAGKASLFGKDYMTKYLPVKNDQGIVIAVLFIGLDFTDGLKALKEKVRAIKIAQTGYVYVLDAREGKDLGKLQIHTAKEGSNIIEAKDSSGHEFIKEIVTKKNGVIRYPWINKELGETSPREKMVAYRHLKEWNWVVCTGASLHELNSEGRIIRNSMLAATGLVVVILVLVFILMVSRWISQPLRRAVAMTEVLASGDFSSVSAVVDGQKSADEVEQLSIAIQNMAYALRNILGKISTSSQEVSAAANSVNLVADQIATGAEELAAQAATVAVAGEEMAATSGDIAQNCSLAADATVNANGAAVAGTSVIQETVNCMGRITAQVKKASVAVANLGARSDQIGEIVDTIGDIADQTNLLALNAAIEAARAGEQGRGFAVVADEVRALAERTTRSTREISDMIKTIQIETKEAVKAIELGVEQVENGAVEAGKTEHAISDIMAHISSLQSQISQIAIAAEEQTATTDEISKNIHQITEVVDITSHSAHEAAAAATQLNGNAEELQRLVHEFKL
jgi:methyl-accepting chemotaxis protein